MLSMRSLALILGLVLSCSVVGLAQTSATIEQDNAPRGQGRVRSGRSHRELNGRKLRRQGLKLQQALGLTEAQQQQMRLIRQRQFDSTKAQREELMKLGEKRRTGTLTEEDRERAKALHSEMRTLRQSLLTEVGGILTPEQRTKMEELKRERQERREDRRERRKGRLPPPEDN